MLQRIRDTLSQIPKQYLKYPTIGGNHKHGERVFCYEFYYHLKNQFGDLPFDVTGEPIKGSGLLPGLNQSIIPDFVIHNYGHNRNNEVAIEVKVSPRITAKEIWEDLDKLRRMMGHPLRYNLGVFIIANSDFQRKVNRSTLYGSRIQRIIRANPSIHVINILPFEEDERLNEFINDDDYEDFNHENI